MSVLAPGGGGSALARGRPPHPGRTVTTVRSNSPANTCIWRYACGPPSYVPRRRQPRRRPARDRLEAAKRWHAQEAGCLRPANHRRSSESRSGDVALVPFPTGSAYSQTRREPLSRRRLRSRPRPDRHDHHPPWGPLRAITANSTNAAVQRTPSNFASPNTLKSGPQGLRSRRACERHDPVDEAGPRCSEAQPRARRSGCHAEPERQHRRDPTFMIREAFDRFAPAYMPP